MHKAEYKLEVKDSVGPIAIGNIVHYDVSNENFDILSKKQLLNSLFIEIRKAADDVYDMYSSQMFQDGWKKTDYKPLFIFISDKYNKYLTDYVINKEMQLEEAMSESLQDFLDFDEEARHYPENTKQLDHVYETFEYIKSAADHAYVKWFYSQLKEPTIIVSSVFKKSFFYEMPWNIKGIILKEDVQKDEPLLLASTSHKTIVFSDYDFMDDNLVIIYPEDKKIIVNPSETQLNTAQKQYLKNSDILMNKYNKSESIFDIFAMSPAIIDLNLIDKSKWYEGFCMYRSEPTYLSSGRIPQFQTFYDEFIEILKNIGQKEAFFQLPKFDENSTFPNITIRQYTDAFMREYHTYYPWIESLAKASTDSNKKVSIGVSGVTQKREYSKLFSMIKKIFDIYDAPIPQLGYIMDTVEMLDQFEQFVDTDFIVISVDDLIQKMDKRNQNCEQSHAADSIFKLIGDQVISAHQYYRLRHITQRHIVMGSYLADIDVFHKFRTKGFREFAIPLNHLQKVVPYIDSVIQSKGKYSGVHEKRKLAKDTKPTVKKTNLKSHEDNEYVIKTRIEKIRSARAKSKLKKESDKEEENE